MQQLLKFSYLSWAPRAARSCVGGLVLMACAEQAAPGASGAGSGDVLSDAGSVCVGPKIPAEALHAQPGPVDPTPTQASPTIGAPMPTFALTDVQPASCGYKFTYGLKPFQGRVTLVALLAGW